MNKEDFLYQYLITYNEYENKFEGKDAVSYWREKDLMNGSSGLIFMVLRNALVHNTHETFLRLEGVNSFSNILSSLRECKVESKEKIKYMNIFFENDKVKSDLQNKKFKLINSNREDVFKLFQRKDGEFYCTIFFSHANLLYDTGVSTYNQEKGCKEYFNNFYIETELYNNEYIFRFFKKDDSVITHQLAIYVDRNFNPKRLYQSVNFIDITIINHGIIENIEKKITSEELEKLTHEDIKNIFDAYCCDSTIREATKKVKTAYKQLNNFLHIIGVQNSV